MKLGIVRIDEWAYKILPSMGTVGNAVMVRRIKKYNLKMSCCCSFVDRVLLCKGSNSQVRAICPWKSKI